MRAQAVPFSPLGLGLGLGLGLATIIAAATFAHAAGKPTSSQAAATAVSAPQHAAKVFVCDAQPGDWCDLRDWDPATRQPAPENAPSLSR